MENEGYKLERMLVQMLDAEREAQGMDRYELGRLAFPDRKEGRKVFSHIVQGYTSREVRGKMRGLSIEDFHRFCTALHKDPIRVFSEAVMALEKTKEGQQCLPRTNAKPKDPQENLPAMKKAG